MRSVGKFMDKVLVTSEMVEDEHDGDVRYILNRFEVEAIKDELIPFTTANKAGSNEIEVYCKDVSVEADIWLVLLLEHTSFSWDNVTMMRAKHKSIRTRRLQLYFRNRFVDEYAEGISLMERLLRKREEQ